MPFRQACAQQHVGARPDLALGLQPNDASSQPLDSKSECLEDIEQQCVVLEAIAATSAQHELVDQAWEIEPDRPAEQDIEIFERDARRMRGDDAAQRVETGLCGAAVADPLEICRD